MHLWCIPVSVFPLIIHPFRSAFCVVISLGFPKENTIFFTLVRHLSEITLRYSNSGHLHQMVAVGALTLPLWGPIYNTFSNFLPPFRGSLDTQPIPTARIWDGGKATVTGNKLSHRPVWWLLAHLPGRNTGVQTILDLHAETTSIYLSHSSSLTQLIS